MPYLGRVPFLLKIIFVVFTIATLFLIHSIHRLKLTISPSLQKLSRLHPPLHGIVGGHEKLVLFYSKSYLQGEEWLSPQFTRDGQFYRLENGGVYCPASCVFTYDKIFSESAHTLIFSILSNRRRPETPPFPPKRNSNQFWIGYTLESPEYHPKSEKDLLLDPLFNWTATYRLDSDIPSLYGHFEKLEEPSSTVVARASNFTSKKLAVTLVSNCGARSGRDTIVLMMRRYMAVDTFGKCGDPCPGPGHPDTTCRRYLGQNYKFFLAFENSLCLDYVTEKFWSAFEVGMVPVVYGLASYHEIAPPHSYINVFDFGSIRELTDYLLYLDKNEEEYQKYFEWKKIFRIQLDLLYASHLCDICIKLWHPNPRGLRTPQALNSFGDWWMGKGRSESFKDLIGPDGWNEEMDFKGLSPETRKEILDRKSACLNPNILLHEFSKKLYVQ